MSRSVVKIVEFRRNYDPMDSGWFSLQLCMMMWKNVISKSIQDLFNVQVRNNTIDYLEREQFDQANTILQIEEIKKDPKNLTWCGLMTSTKRGYLEQLLMNTINELVVWNNLGKTERSQITKNTELQLVPSQFLASVL